MTVSKRERIQALLDVLGLSIRKTYTVTLPGVDEFIDASRQVLYRLEHDHDNGTPADDFTTHLIDALAASTEEQRRLLARAYPALTTAVDIYLTHETGVRVLTTFSNLD